MNPNIRGQRISRQELIIESQEVLQNAGVGNHSRAQFLVEVSREVVGSENPLFCQLQPKIHSHESESWVRAFSLVFQYLTEHNLQSTLSAVESEFNQGQLPKELTTFRKGEASTQLMKILKFAPPPRGTTFKDRVKQYMVDVKNHDLMLLQQEDEDNYYNNNNYYQSSTRRNGSIRKNDNSTTVNTSKSSPTPRSGSVQSKSRVTRKYDIRPSPQPTENKSTSTPKESNRYSLRSKSVTRSSSKKRNTEDDDFIIDSITQQKNP